MRHKEEPTKQQLQKLRAKMTVPEIAKYFNMGVRKLEKLLSKYRIRKFEK